MMIDARVPVVFGPIEEAAPEDALLLEGPRLPDGRPGISFVPGPGVLALGCACCAPRGPLARAIGDLFTARARGTVPFFRRVVAVAETDEGRATMRAALVEDPVCSARFRIV